MDEETLDSTIRGSFECFFVEDKMCITDRVEGVVRGGWGCCALLRMSMHRLSVGVAFWCGVLLVWSVVSVECCWCGVLLVWSDECRRGRRLGLSGECAAECMGDASLSW